MPYFKPKTAALEAHPWKGPESLRGLSHMFSPEFKMSYSSGAERYMLITREGPRLIVEGDYILRNSMGDYLVIKEYDLLSRYDQVIVPGEKAIAKPGSD